MSKAFGRPIIIQRINEETETWEDLYRVHARINKAKSDNEYLNAGSIRSTINLTFEIRYFSALEAIPLNLQKFRILYHQTPYDIKDYDDFKLQHKTVKLLGVSY